MEMNEISGAVVDAAIKVHTALGPALLEHPYQAVPQARTHQARTKGVFRSRHAGEL